MKTSWNSIIAVVAVLCPITANVSAQGLPSRKVVTIVRTPTPPQVDGFLDDPVWSQATAIEDFHQYDPADHGDPSEATSIYILFDDEYLYVGARLWDSSPDQIFARQMIQEQPVDIDDFFEIVLDPFNNMRTGYQFQVNPNGIRHDGVFEQPTQINTDWDGIWYAVASIDDKGWIGEVAIPFKTLNFDPSNSDWGFTFGRSIARKTEKIGWSSFNRAINPGSAGVITGLKGLEQGVGLDVVPAIIVTGEKDFVGGQNDTQGDPSLDVFYNFSPSLTGVLTFNTDFSATEVDSRQVNLTRFPLLFPEKRDFFLRDLDVFSFGGLTENAMPFFSRRLGLSADGRPVDLDSGAKLTGRTGPWNLGILGVRQAAFESIAENTLFVGRAAANVLEESSIGVIVTDGDPTSNLSNSLAGADFRYRNTRLRNGKTVEGKLWYQRSATEGVEADEAAWGFHLAFPNNEGLHGEIRFESIDENFNPALGFISRRGEWTSLQIGNNKRFNQPWLRNIFTGISADNFTNAAGDLQTRQLWFRPFRIENNRGDQYGILLERNREVLYEDFEIFPGIVIPLGDYDFNRYRFELQRATERLFAPSLVVQNGDFFNGDRLQVNAGIDWRPTRRVLLRAAYEFNDVELPAGDFVTRLIQLRANFAFSAEWSWMNFLQYDNVSKSAGINSRLRWNPRAGDDLHIVWNLSSDAQGSFTGLESRRSNLTLKYVRTFRF